MSKVNYFVSRILPCLVLGFFSVSCSDSQFSSSSSASNSTTKNTDGAEKTGLETTGQDATASADHIGAENTVTIQETFEINSDKKPIDLVLFVDQSQSMPEEMEIVKTNIPKFRENLEKFGDLRMSLINRFDTGRLNDLITPEFLGLFNSHIEILAKSKNGVEAFIKFLEETHYKTNAGKSKGTEFFRANANKYYVIVSDEDEELEVLGRAVSDDGEAKKGKIPRAEIAPWFHAYLKERSVLKDLKVYAFAKKSENSSCDAKQLGQTYLDLAKLMNTEVFDICEPDWTNSLKKLEENIEKNAYNISLKRKPVKILSITVGNTEVDLSKIKVIESTIDLQMPVEELLGKTVTVEYQ